MSANIDDRFRYTVDRSRVIASQFAYGPCLPRSERSNLTALSARTPHRVRWIPAGARGTPQGRPAPTGASSTRHGPRSCSVSSTRRAGLPALRWAPAPHRHELRPAGPGATRGASGQTIAPARTARKRLGVSSLLQPQRHRHEHRILRSFQSAPVRRPRHRASHQVGAEGAHHVSPSRARRFSEHSTRACSHRTQRSFIEANISPLRRRAPPGCPPAP